jgi:DinB superfamily
MQRILLVFLLLLFPFQLLPQDQKPQDQKPATLRSILLEQLRTTHNQKDWFVPANVAVEGLTPEQARWIPSAGNHSVGQLAYHLVFWNREELARFKGEKPAPYSGKNDDTFNNFDSKTWNDTVQQLDQVLTDWEQAVAAADEKKLEQWAPTIARIGTHNAYHIGQIVYVRKLQGSWDPEKGVK